MIWREPYVTLTELEAQDANMARMVRSLIRQRKIQAERIPFETGRPYGVPIEELKKMMPDWKMPTAQERSVMPEADDSSNSDAQQIRQLLLQVLQLVS